MVILFLTAAGASISLPVPHSQTVAFALLHGTDKQAESDADLIHNAFSKMLCGKGDKIELNAANGDLRLKLNGALDRIATGDDHGGLFLYVRCFARASADGDFDLAAAPDAPEARSMRFQQMMTKLRKAIDQQAIWVFLDLETELGEEQIRSCISQGLANPDPAAPPILVVAGVRTSAEETQLEFSSERLAHWIAMGLEGAAGPPGGPGIDDPAAITQEDLVSYLRLNLSASADGEHGLRLLTSRDQVAPMPDKTIPEDSVADGAVAQRPRFTEEMVREQAEKWADQLAQQKIRYIIVPELLELQKDATTTLAASGFATHVHRLLVERLKRIAQNRYDVIDDGRLNAFRQYWRQAQREKGQNFDLVVQRAFDLIVTETDIKPRELAILIGKLSSPGKLQHPAEFSLQLEAGYAQPTLPEAGSKSVRAVATPSLQLQAGMHSFVPKAPVIGSEQQQAPSAVPIAPPPLDPKSLADPAYLDGLKRQIDDFQKWANDQKHPLTLPNPELQIGVSLLQNNGRTKLPLSFSEDEKTAWVTVSSGDMCGIDILSRRREGIFMRLFVDGLNTLPEKVIGENGEITYMRAQPVNPDDAAYWYIPPNIPTAVDGFYSDVRKDSVSTFNSFQIVQAAEAEATAQGLPQETGLITALFYEMRQVAPGIKQSVGGHGVGTKLGPQIKHELKFYEGTSVPGKLVAVIQLQYRAPGN